MRWVVVVALAGCYSPAPLHCEARCERGGCPTGLTCESGFCVEPGRSCDRVTADASNDVAHDTVPAAFCHGEDDAPFQRICIPIGTEIDPMKILGAELDTDAMCTLMTPELCVVAGVDISIAGTTRAYGSRALVLIAENGISVSGTLDVAGHATDVPPRRPPAANRCAGMAGQPSGSGGGGGAGGTYLGPGGSGGSGAVVGGMTSSATPAALRGGCAGGNGGAGTSEPGLGGDGGGAVYLLAARMSISGKINASGGAGRAAPLRFAGGGGGGSGGTILIHAPQLTLFGTTEIWALGGGGAPGSTSTTASAGNESTGPQVPASMRGNSTAGTGGAGSSDGVPDGMSGGSGLGGGGGGGGHGYIRIRPVAPQQTAKIVPAPTT